MTTLAYENAELINLLKKRGSLIKSGKYDKAREVDKQINDLKNEKME